MYKYEIHPGEGGADAAAFATQLGDTLAKSFNATAAQQGRIVAVESRDCL